MDDVYYGEVMSVTTLNGDRPDAIVINEHAFIDLGLPSGLLWADRNVGASSPLNGGDYFAWGETEPKETYSEANYKWWNGSFSKYNSFDHKYDKNKLCLELTSWHKEQYHLQIVNLVDMHLLLLAHYYSLNNKFHTYTRANILYLYLERPLV